MFIYMTTNLVNGKKYIGRCAHNPDSYTGKKYLGSGKWLIMAIKKPGRENFKREVLEVLSENATKHDLRECEYKWLNFFKAPDNPEFYNISWNNGGFGKGDSHTKEFKEKLSKTMKEKVYENGLPEEWKKNVIEAAKGRIPWNKGKKFSEEEKKKMHGNRRRHSKFNEEQISEIRELYDLKLPAYKIAEKFGCSHHTVMKIVRFEGKYAKKD